MQRALFSLIFIMFIGISYGQMHQSVQPPEGTEILKAVCMINPTQGNIVKGMIVFTREKEGIRIVADLDGLTPGKHGIHIHEKGDCSAPDGTSAGGHFNPTSKTHGAPMDMSSHEGDMGNLVADENGKAHLELLDPMMSFKGDRSIIGRSVIIHKDADDLKTQPTGNSGPRIGCGVIEKR